jgi:hypothetical protein
MRKEDAMAFQGARERGLSEPGGPECGRARRVTGAPSQGRRGPRRPDPLRDRRRKRASLAGGAARPPRGGRGSSRPAFRGSRATWRNARQVAWSCSGANSSSPALARRRSARQRWCCSRCYAQRSIGSGSRRTSLRSTRQPSVIRARTVRPLPPLTIEQLRAWLLAHQRCTGRAARQCSRLCGRPTAGGALAPLQVDRQRTVLMEDAVAQGRAQGPEDGSSPTDRPTARASPPGPRRYVATAGRPDDEAFVFPARDGRPWGLHDWQNWRCRTFTVAAAAVGLDGVGPYDLRHPFASLLVHEGRLSVVEIAAQMGHSPTMTYAPRDRRARRTCRRRSRCARRASRSGPIPARKGRGALPRECP